ncbi:DUF3800 domain-containing protein [Sulfitobacter mediterraneus]|uniref:DUF3800 domain-containing protein n=1 Tax=Sulfitobacter mediterraneus TaxID=83219 RepID=UPI0030C73168
MDESGETGITRIRDGNLPGASPYFVLGAVVCQPTAEVLAKNTLKEFKEEIRRKNWKHATDLNHAEKVYFARLLGRLPVRYFALISKKETLANYKEAIKFDPQRYYNKCLKYLLELICSYLAEHLTSVDDLSVVLERRNHNYDAMYRYLQKVKDRPIYPQSSSLKNLNPFAISTRAKGEEDMLEIADFVAHSVFQITNRSKSNFGIPETKYFVELSKCFAGDRDLKMLNTGLKCVHDLDSIDLDMDVRELLLGLRVKAPSSKRRATT